MAKIQYDAGKTIGETFGQELIDSGITKLTGWGEDGTYELEDDATQQEIDDVAALFTAHDNSATLPEPSALEKLEAVTGLSKAEINAALA